MAEVFIMKRLSLAVLVLAALPLQAQQRPTAASNRMTLADTSLLPPIDPARAM